MRVSRCLWCDFYFFKQKTAYEMRISDWSSDVCSSDLIRARTHVLVFGGGKIQHAVDADFRLSAKGRIEVNFVAAELQGIGQPLQREIGRASCRERVCQYVSISVVAVSLKQRKTEVIRDAQKMITNHK